MASAPVVAPNRPGSRAYRFGLARTAAAAPPLFRGGCPLYPAGMDSAVEEGSHERTRLSPIPCYKGKIQGISLALASGTRIWCLNPHYNQRLTSKFPTQRNRELNGPYQ